MAKTRAEKITNYQEQISKLQEQMKLEMQKHKEDERKSRTKRLCLRHGMLEKHMPDLIGITNEQFESFIVRAINTSYGRETLAKIIKQAGATATQNPTDLADTTANGSSANPQTTAGSEA